MAKSSFDLPHLDGSHAPAEEDAASLETPVQRAVVAKAILPDDPSLSTTEIGPIDEIVSLADTAGVQVVAAVTQRRRKPHPATYLGKGKLEELRELVEEEKPSMVLVDDPLSPGQGKNLEERVGLRVVDRTELIMDIFATHANTHQAKLQVELAQLRYSQSRLKRMWTHLSRMEGGIGMRGPGETQLETDRRIIRRKIQLLRTKLEEIERQGTVQHKSREGTFRVALVGYTNAGKSTLMRALTGADVLVEDQLFSTLDTCTRQWELEGTRDVILSDTVGFIRRLPHTLVASFHATLMEVREADLLLHVVDGHTPQVEHDVDAVEETLEAIGCADQPKIVVFNKVDRLPEDRRIDVQYLLDRYPDSLLVSAQTGVGLDALRDIVIQIATEGESIEEYVLPIERGDLVARLRDVGQVEEERYEEDGIHVRVQLGNEARDRFDALLRTLGRA